MSVKNVLHTKFLYSNTFARLSARNNRKHSEGGDEKYRRM